MATAEQLARLREAEEYVERMRQRARHPTVRLPGGGTGVVEWRSDEGDARVRVAGNGRLVTLRWQLIRPIEDV